ncbi:Nif3-like dinuclear metal center hexameric protein [Paenibacillus sp. N1-5-1-14]|uniref:Nif3-like dinuclear metal center hexameric protein n=1 Tax=Paenibacillus radicibacter TaxID=2972488 RepID=UPI002159125C|nr:Nif3-like dinuclear metal center hexameric protein [Paenibacillus radicibacter]MCR8641961.1 Nif3-like dinuclear metal center hexameric protein [Paenibacillus radicibacter]
MFAKGAAVIQLFEELAPKHYAMPDDKIGLQLGTLNKEIRHILVALDVTEAVVEEAISQGADLIIAHHAIIFRALAHLRTDTTAGRLYEKLIKHDIAVYIAHTNLDVATGGVNDLLAGQLGLTDLGHLEDVHTEKLNKLVVFVPKTHHEEVQRALFNAGAGHIGQYSHCSFNTEGQGTFMPGDSTQPFIGAQGKFERVDEVRVETIVPEAAARRVVQAMLKAHPYEEVAYDLYPLDLKGRVFGLGRVGKLPAPVTLAELAGTAKQAFDVPTVRVVGDLTRTVRKAAVLGGSGARYWRSAKFAGADVLVTGDIDYHSAHDALADGMTIIDVGHNVEKVMKEAVAKYMRERFTEKRYTTTVTASTINTEVFQFV